MHLWSRVLTAVVVSLGCSARITAPTHLSGTSANVELFNQAAQEADVPADFLAAWSHLETRFQDVQPDKHDGDEGESHLISFGIMGLTPAQIARASALTGDNAQTIQSNAAANVRAVAFLLRDLADRHGRIEGDLDATSAPLPWLDAMALARGIPDEGMRDEYVRMLADVVGHGLTGTDNKGLTIVIEGRGTIRVPARQVIHSALEPQDPYSARYLASPNHTAGRGGVAVDMIIIHTTQGSYAGSVSWFQNPDSNVSAHYVIRSSDGQITQMVQLENKGWHTGNSNYNARSIGVEHEGFVADPGRWYTEAMYTKSARLVRWLADRYSIPLDRQHIIGHYQIPRSGSGGACAPTATNCGGSGGHTDPGAGGTQWNWTHFMALVGGSTGGGTPGTGTTDRRLVGVTYNQEQGSTARISGATVRLLSNGTQVATTTSNSTGFWAFNVASGAYTIRATAGGFQEATREGAADTVGDNWASIGLTPTPPPAESGTYRGVIYAGATAGDTPVEGATVSLSSGQSYTTGANGSFVFTLPVGTITATASKTGYRTASLMRTVTLGATVWGSIQLLAEESGPTIQPPATPNAISPIDNVELDGTAIALNFSRVTDPQSAAVTYELEVHAGAELAAQPLLTLEAPQASASPVVVHVPVTLDPGAFAWRVRARSSNGPSAWSATAVFRARAPLVEEPAASSSSSGEPATSFDNGGEPGEEGTSASSSSGGGPDEGDGAASVGGCSSAQTTSGGTPLMGLGMLLAGLLFSRRRCSGSR